ncbi:protein of unknown function [Acidithiobacillus ferrivorans]|uniref:Uncharacterized protein n=1 Tax=Acidithiobacillus ferrivorans TaxID=160808 RepID=A0A060UTJ0_9PROT|nr:hypothetical protein AFERRI_560185 [Acidithiobacillus ferrivorans]SMH66080.1 protein of unknown function [Acidithiobacillus ferrivorans]
MPLVSVLPISVSTLAQGPWEAIDQLVNQLGRVLGRTPIASGAGGCLNRTFYGERVIYSPIKALPCKKRAWKRA